MGNYSTIKLQTTVVQTTDTDNMDEFESIRLSGGSQPQEITNCRIPFYMIFWKRQHYGNRLSGTVIAKTEPRREGEDGIQRGRRELFG